MSLVATTIASDVTAPVNFVLEKGMLTQARKFMPYHNGTLPGTLTKNGGSMSIRWERWQDMTVNTTPLGEAPSPSVYGQGRDSQAMGVDRIDVAVAKYGDGVIFNEEIDLFQVNARSVNFMNNLGRNAGEVLNTLMSSVMTGAGVTQVERAASAASTAAVNDAMDLNTIKRAVNVLQQASARKFLPMSSGSANTNTTPQRSAYYGICNFDVEEDIRTLAGFVPVEQYASQTEVKIGEFGSVGGVRWFSTETGPVSLGGGTSGGTAVRETSSDADVYTSVIYGEEAVGSVGLGETLPDDAFTQGDRVPAVEIIKHEIGSSGLGDPFNEQGGLFWKAWWAGKVLNATWIVKLESAASTLA